MDQGRMTQISRVHEKESFKAYCCCALQVLDAQFAGGRLLAAISSRPGQCGRVDGYILEGKELEFYQRKLQKKKSK